MKIDNGTLKKSNRGAFLVTLPTKKGSADFPIPAAAIYFNTDAVDAGTEVEVERDVKNRIVKVSLPGQAETLPAVASRTAQRPWQTGGGLSQPAALKGLPKASAKVLGLPFHNPYTFLPFPEKMPHRRRATLLSADELEGKRERLTGVLELAVTTETPLLSCHPTEVSDKGGHKTYQALTIGPDVIVPATGVRGALRTLMTILTGGTLGYLDEYAYLCQGRDTQLGPQGLNSPPLTPKHVFLAEVEQPGTALKSGVVRLGKTQLVKLEDLEKRTQRHRLDRGERAPTLWVGLDNHGQPTTDISLRQTDDTPWKLKLSGRPINLQGKREGAFLPGPQRLELPPELWAAYSGRNAHGDHRELRTGDLIWLEPADPNLPQITYPEDVKSLQWARWGKSGQAMKDKIPGHILPDYEQDDGKVDAITDLFGQVAPKRNHAPQFAARIRPENLMFWDAAPKAQDNRVTRAPLMQSHAGCVAFYRNSANADEISEAGELRGYKVYRVQEDGADAPWRYDVQGVYGTKGELLRPQQAVNKTCELVPKGETGTLRIAFHSLTKRELALLLQACAVSWRLGGGKPLGLGLCAARVTGLLDEDGELMQIPDWTLNHVGGGLRIEGWQQEVRDIELRVGMWTASQKPVPKLRYPRAVDDNRNRKSRGGHAWFQRHASPRMVTNRGDGSREPGLNPLHIDGKIKQDAETAKQPLDSAMPLIAGQMLPPFDPEDPLSDVLYGYDAIGAETEDRQRPRRRVFLQVEPFDPEQHITGAEQSGGNQGKNAEFRREQRESRETNR